MNLKESGVGMWEGLEGENGGEKCNYINLSSFFQKRKTIFFYYTSQS